MPVITVEHLTKDYGAGRGVFDVSFEVEQGEVLVFLDRMAQVRRRRFAIYLAS